MSGEKALLIRQLLSPGDTLELRYLGMLLGTDPETRASGERVNRRRKPRSASLRQRPGSLPATGLEPGGDGVGAGIAGCQGPDRRDHLKALLKTLH